MTGTSIGSLNGALYAQGDYAKAEKLWYSVTPQQVVDIETDDPKTAERDIIFKSLLGGVSTKPLEELLQEHLDETSIRQSPIRLGIVTVGLANMNANYLPIDKIESGFLHKSLLASSTVYPAFKPVKIHEKYYIDGGFQDNLPINLAINMGAEEIFAVDLKAIGLKKKTKNKQVKITILRPSRPLGSILLFDPEIAKRNAQLGYLDTLRLHGKLSGRHIYFKARDFKRNISKIQDRFYDLIHRALQGRTTEFFDLFRVMSNLFLFKKTKLNETLDQQRFLLHAVDYIACLTGLDDLAIYTVQSFSQQAQVILEDLQRESADLKQ